MRDGWKSYKLGEVVEIKYGKDHKKLGDGSYPLYGSGGVMRYVDSYLYDNESVLIPRKGTLTNLFYLNEPFSTVDTMFWTKIDNSIAVPRFLYYLLKTYDLASLDEGAAIPSLTTKALNVVNINLPPLETQKKIASILSGYDDLIENNLKRIKILEEMAQQTYEEWFVRMRFPGYESATINAETGLPEGWEKVKLGDLWEIQSSKRIFLSDYVDSGIPFFRGKEITQKSENSTISDLIYIKEDKFKEIKKKYGAPSQNDILITAVGTLGNLYMVRETDEEFYFKDGNLIWFKSNEDYSSYYLLYYLKSTSFQNYVNNTAIGSSQKALTIKGMKESDIIKPSNDLIDSFDKVIIPISRSIENLQNQNLRLREARDILLPRLMMGMIEVDNLKENESSTKTIMLNQVKKEASKEFKEAVLIACLVDRFGSQMYPLGRKRYTKLSYLFHRYSDNKIEDYKRKAAGPYNPKTKYAGPEKIALGNKYIKNWKSDKGTAGFVVSDKIGDAQKYYSNYWPIEDLDWLTSKFKFKSNDELELYATVDNSLVELAKNNLDFTVKNVLEIIKAEKEWEAKLEREIFNEQNIEKSIDFLISIFHY